VRLNSVIVNTIFTCFYEVSQRVKKMQETSEVINTITHAIDLLDQILNMD